MRTPAARGAAAGVCSGSVCTRDPRLAVPPGGPAQPQHRGLAARAGADPGLRALHHRRHRAGLLGDGAPAAAARRRARCGARHRRLGGAGGHHRRPHLPRDHLTGEILRRRWRPDEGVRHLGGRSRHLGRRRRWRARRLDRGPTARHPVRGGGRRAGTRAAAGPGGRPARQLVQQRAVRWPDHPAVGSGDPPDGPGQPGARAARRRRAADPRTGPLPADLPLRGAVEPRRGRAGPRPRPPAASWAGAGRSRST